jgi:hypothetical protein
LIANRLVFLQKKKGNEQDGLSGRQCTKWLTSGSSETCLPIRFSSDHSNITRLTRGLASSGGVTLANLVRMKGSTFPPQALRLYMPEHCKRCEISCVCTFQVRDTYDQR